MATTEVATGQTKASITLSDEEIMDNLNNLKKSNK